jgi:hypothetical protein
MTVTIAHIAGVPFEEWLLPLATTGTGITVALRTALHRSRRPDAVTRHEEPNAIRAAEDDCEERARPGAAGRTGPGWSRSPCDTRLGCDDSGRDRWTGGGTMMTPAIVAPEEWEAARQQLLLKEKALTRARDALAA